MAFDEETREPTIYSADDKRERVASIPWVREGDTMTILSNPGRFSAQAVEAARSRYGRILEQQRGLQKSTEDQIRILESSLLEAWRTYEAATAAERPSLRRDILAVEASLRTAEEGLYAQTDRSLIRYTGFGGIYTPPMPYERRGIPITSVAATEEGSS